MFSELNAVSPSWKIKIRPTISLLSALRTPHQADGRVWPTPPDPSSQRYTSLWVMRPITGQSPPNTGSSQLLGWGVCSYWWLLPKPLESHDLLLSVISSSFPRDRLFSHSLCGVPSGTALWSCSSQHPWSPSSGSLKLYSHFRKTSKPLYDCTRRTAVCALGQ